MFSYKKDRISSFFSIAQLKIFHQKKIFLISTAICFVLLFYISLNIPQTSRIELYDYFEHNQPHSLSSYSKDENITHIISVASKLS
jgi:hypothetical protein